MRNPLPDLRPGWIPLGWFIAASLTALVLLAVAGLGLVGNEASAENFWVPLSLAFGFGTAGFALGVRVGAAPILHGLGIGLFSVLVWAAVNVFLGEPTDQTAWTALGTESAAGLLLLQTAAAVVGARMGVRWARRG